MVVLYIPYFGYSFEMKNTIDNKDLWSRPTTLDGSQVRLEPLSLAHLDSLTEYVLYKNAWHSLIWGTKTKEDLKRGILNSGKMRETQTANYFAIVKKDLNQAVGMTRLMNFDRLHKGVEIGGTWLGEKVQKTNVNTENKLLLLQYCFETLNVQRVELKADSLNFNSQKAILRIGAKFEGELRNSCLLPDGRKHSYRVYSIIDSEWPFIKITLNQYLQKYV